jgi:hypothetical protein
VKVGAQLILSCHRVGAKLVGGNASGPVRTNLPNPVGHPWSSNTHNADQSRRARKALRTAVLYLLWLSPYNSGTPPRVKINKSVRRRGEAVVHLVVPHAHSLLRVVLRNRDRTRGFHP